MPKFAANLTMLFNEAPFMERFALAAKAGFEGVEYLFPYDFDKDAIRAELVEWENRLKIKYDIRDSATGERLTRGHTVQVAVKLPEMAMCFISPAILFEKLGVPMPCDAA